MVSTVDEALADHIYSLDKEIREDWNWQSGPGGLFEEVSVQCIHETHDIMMKGWCSPVDTSEFWYSLNYKGGVEIRKWEPEGRHKNENGEMIQGSHKHKWTKIGQGDKVYSVDDVSTSDVNKAFQDFCDECNIDFNGDYTTQQVL